MEIAAGSWFMLEMCVFGRRSEPVVMDGRTVQPVDTQGLIGQESKGTSRKQYRQQLTNIPNTISLSSCEMM